MSVNEKEWNDKLKGMKWRAGGWRGNGKRKEIGSGRNRGRSIGALTRAKASDNKTWKIFKKIETVIIQQKVILTVWII